MTALIPTTRRRPFLDFLRRVCSRQGAAALAVLIGCLLGATGLAVSLDRISEARLRRQFLAGSPSPPFGELSTRRTPGMASKMVRAANSDTRMVVGSKAPDFTLPDAEGRPVTLRQFQGKRPVVLVFGSFGCNLFCGRLNELQHLRDTWGNRAEFLFIYISEAPHNSSPLMKASCPLPPPTNDAANGLRRVRWYQKESGTALSWLLDKKDERVETAYSAWPRRLVLVGTDGRVAFDAGHGFKSDWNLRDLERHLELATAPGTLH